MSKLRLGTYLLPPAEVVLIRTIMRLFAQNRDFGWVFADEGPYDALIMDGALAKDNDKEVAHLARVVLKLTSGRSLPSRHTLQRPIKAEKLQEWLETAALDLPRQGHASPQGPVSVLAMKEARFKLLRWPPNTVLQNDASRIRMATLLSRRALQLAELAELSQQSLDACIAFIERLMPMQLIACESMAPLAAGAPAANAQQPLMPAPVTTPTAAQAPLQRGLIGAIRRRFGL